MHIYLGEFGCYILQGEEQKKLDVLSNEVFVKALISSRRTVSSSFVCFAHCMILKIGGHLSVLEEMSQSVVAYKIYSTHKQFNQLRLVHLKRRKKISYFFGLIIVLSS